MTMFLSKTFSEEEFTQRHDRIRRQMEKEKIDVLLVYGNNGWWRQNWVNIRYISNVLPGITPCSCLVFPLEGEPMLVVSPCQMEGWTTWEGSVVRDIRWGDDIRGNVKIVVEKLKELRLEKGTIGYTKVGRDDEEVDIPAGDYRTIRHEFPEARLVDATDVMTRLRMVKSAAEVEEMRRAAKLNDLAMVALVDAAQEGATENDLYAAVMMASTRNGSAKENMINMGSAPMEGSPVYAPAYNRGRTLARGDYIMNEFGITTTAGYTGQICRPVTIGEPTRAFQKVWEAAREIFDLIIEQTRPGTNTGELGEKCREITTKGGFYAAAPHVHGEGLSWSRPIIWPSYTPSGSRFPTKDVILEPNITFACHIFLGEQKSKIMVAIGDLVRVTETGCELLTRYEPRGIVVK